jgi:hypothetical protein
LINPLPTFLKLRVINVSPSLIAPTPSPEPRPVIQVEALFHLVRLLTTHRSDVT